MTLFRNVALFAQKVANATPALAAIERTVLRPPGERAAPPILIVGCPRSGTTLLYEVLTSSLRTAYPTNAASLLYRAPVLATLLAQALSKEHEPKFKSETGYIAGLLAPSEAGALMRHWFTGPQPMAAHDPARLDRIAVALAVAMGGPLVLKNLYLDRAIDLILSAFPGCVILRLRRDPRFTAQSILATRQREFRDQAEWWGPRPAGVEALLSQSPARQVAWQIVQIENWIDALSRDQRVEGRLFSCGYDELCANPAGVIERFSSFYHQATGTQLSERGASPVGFSASEKVSLPPAQWTELEEALAAFGRTSGKVDQV